MSMQKGNPLQDGMFTRQARVIGGNGQERLSRARVVIVGCGATGSTASMLLVRAGIGTLRIIDRDFVEASNLHREILFSRHHIGMPKAAAAGSELSRIKSTTRIECISDDLNPNTARLLKGFDVIVDCTDNMETRHLINEFSVRHGVPWIYGACVATEGMSALFIPGRAPCLRCLFRKGAAPGTLDTCETAGIISPASSIVGSWQASQCIKLLAGFGGLKGSELFHFSLGRPSFSFSGIRKNPACPVCVRRRFGLLDGRKGNYMVCMCGRNAFSISPRNAAKVDLAGLKNRISKNKEFKMKLLTGILHVQKGKNTVFVFDNGRAIIKDVKSAAEAKRIYNNIMGI